VVEGLFEETGEGPRLLGSRCSGCGTPYFPRSSLCHNPACQGGEMRDARFGPHGQLWSYAVQNYPPPAPARFDEPYTPYALGVVDLEDGLRVIGRLRGGEALELRAGSPVELVLAPLCSDAQGRELISWQFEPRAAKRT